MIFGQLDKFRAVKEITSGIAHVGYGKFRSLHQSDSKGRAHAHALPVFETIVKDNDICPVENDLKELGKLISAVYESKAVLKCLHYCLNSKPACDLAAGFAAYAVCYSHAKVIAYRLVSKTVFIVVPYGTLLRHSVS